ncbi:hypothetical protein CR205_06345 [Alteribacter lacisalsi]|uniref:Ger(X)C family spore germination protein n=1 Tax=Alteribacter lacisalsi TaxID=2045244 RepID=A0A2W0HBG4_9BACI|nr:Ger(x)C family spore germination protein [Alteribacter lacisalsi]PYZ98211.1 hypothetical protein CR205_06345 [Alteribacter lacisalsi]
MINPFRQLIILLLPFLCTACVPTEVVDDLQFIHAAGFDYIEDSDLVRATVSVPIYGFGQEQESASFESETITAEGRTAKQIRARMNSKSPKVLENSKIEAVIYNEKIAEQGLYEYVDTYDRDPKVGQRVYLAVYAGSTQELLEKKLPIESEISRYIADVIEQNVEHTDIPNTNMHIFTYRYFQEGMDPFLPYLRMDGDQIQIKGMAVFKDDVMKGYINIEDTFIMKMLVESLSEGTYEVDVDGENFATLQNLNAKTRYSVKNHTLSPPEITADIVVTGYINEYSGDTLNDNVLKEIDVKMKEQIKNDAENLITRFQEMGVDPTGLGFQVKTRTRNWNQAEWLEQYPDVKVNVNVTSKITHAGVVE